MPMRWVWWSVNILGIVMVISTVPKGAPWYDHAWIFAGVLIVNVSSAWEQEAKDNERSKANED